MKNRLAPLILALFIAFLPQGLAADEGNLPPALTTPVTVDTGPAGMPLEAVMRSMVDSIGWAPLFRDVPDEQVILRMPETRFIDAFDLVFRLYTDGLAYAALPGGVFVVAPEEIIAEQFPQALVSSLGEAKPSENPVAGASQAVHTIQLTDADEEKLAKAAKLFPDSITYAFFPSKRLLVIKSDEAALEATRQVLAVAGLTTQPPRPDAAAALPHVIDVPNLPDDVLQTLSESFPSVQLRYVASSRKLVVRNASDEVVEEIRQLINALLAPSQDTPKAEEAEPDKPAKPALEDRVYTLKHVSPDDAARIIAFVAPAAEVLVVKSVDNAIWVKATPKVHEIVAENLARYENLAAKEAQAKPEEPETEVRAFEINSDPNAIAEALEQTFPNASFAVTDTAIVVKAAPETLDAIAELLPTLDVEEANTGGGEDAATAPEEARVQEIYLTDYADPNDLLALAQATGLFPQGVKALTDTRTSDIVLVGPEAAVAEAATLLRKLDRPIPQAELRVQVHQVDRTSAKRMGVDLAAILSPFTVNIGGGVNVGYELGASALSAVSAALDSLESRGAAETLVDTRFLAQDGEAVRVKSGGKLTVLTSATTADDQAKPQPLSVDYGLEIELVPEIAPQDGTVTVDLKVSIGGAPVEGAGGTIDISSKEFEDYVRIASGKSVVLGGLITTTESQSETSSPLVSWIPLVGDLFTKKQKTTTSNELLVILTAQILDAPPPRHGGDGAGEGEVSAQPAPPVDQEPAKEVEREGVADEEAPPAVEEQRDAGAETAEASEIENEPAPEPSEASEPASEPAVEPPAEPVAEAAVEPPAKEVEPAAPKGATETVGLAELPSVYAPLPPAYGFLARMLPADAPTIGFSIMVPSNRSEVCLEGLRIEDDQGRPIRGQLRLRSLDAEGNCIRPGAVAVGNVVLDASARPKRIFVILTSGGTTYVAEAGVN